MSGPLQVGSKGEADYPLVRYGPHPHQYMRVMLPDRTQWAPPFKVLARYHGGGWQTPPFEIRAKFNPAIPEIGTAQYNEFLSRGFAVFNVEYPIGISPDNARQIYPRSTFPMLFKQALDFPAWIQENANNQDIWNDAGVYFDGDEIVLAGHSAGSDMIGLYHALPPELSMWPVHDRGLTDYPYPSLTRDTFVPRRPGNNVKAVICNRGLLLDWTQFNGSALGSGGTSYLSCRGTYESTGVSNYDGVPQRVKEAASPWFAAMSGGSSHMGNTYWYVNSDNSPSDLGLQDDNRDWNPGTKQPLHTDPHNAWGLKKFEDFLKSIGVTTSRFRWGTAATNPTGLAGLNEGTAELGIDQAEWVINTVGVTPTAV